LLPCNGVNGHITTQTIVSRGFEIIICGVSELLPELLGALEGQPDRSTLINSTVDVATSLGFEFVAYGVLSGAENVVAIEGETSNIILNYRTRSHPPASGHLTGWVDLAEAANGGLA